MPREPTTFEAIRDIICAILGESAARMESAILFSDLQLTDEQQVELLTQLQARFDIGEIPAHLVLPPRAITELWYFIIHRQHEKEGRRRGPQWVNETSDSPNIVDIYL